MDGQSFGVRQAADKSSREQTHALVQLYAVRPAQRKQLLVR